MWETHQAVRGNAQGGPYLCAHVRRRDYVYARKDRIPDLGSAVDQLQRKCEEHGVNKVFLATDAPDREVEQLEEGLGKKKASSWSSTNLLTMFCTSLKMGAQPSWIRLFAHMPNILSGVTNLRLHFEFKKSEKSKDFPSKIPLICSAKVVNTTVEKGPSGKLPTLLLKDQNITKICENVEHLKKSQVLMYFTRSNNIFKDTCGPLV